MSALTQALLEELSAADLITLAQRIAPYLAAADDDTWMDAKKAAAYLGLSVKALHHRTGARSIPRHQDGPNCKLSFCRSELDAWRRGE